MSPARRPGAAPKKTSAQYILGLSCGPEGGAAALLRDGKVAFSAFEPPPASGAAAFPAASVKEALEKASSLEGEVMGVKDLAAVSFCGKPLLEFSRFRREWEEHAPAGYSRYASTAAYAFHKRGLGGRQLLRELAAASWGEAPARLFFPEHQLCCAASAFYPSPFQDAAVLSLDGPGEEAAAAISLGSGGTVKLLRELVYPDSPQLLCSALAAWAGYAPDSAWELFTAPGPEDAARAERFRAAILGQLAAVREDGSLRLDRRYFRAAEGMRPDRAAWAKLFAFAPLPSGDPAGPQRDFAAAARAAIEEIVYLLGAQAKRLACSNALCLCAGPEIKLAAEGKLKSAGLFSSVWSQPYSATEGKAAGAAMAARHIGLGARREDRCALPDWGDRAPEPLPEETASPLNVDPEKAAARGPGPLRAAYYWLSVVPAALSGKRPAAAAPEGTSFYRSRPRVYAAGDLAGPA